MAVSLTPAEEAVYTALWEQVSTEGELDAGDAVTLLMLSGLDPQTDLRTIWDFADPETEGYLTKEGFFLSLRLCAVGQKGQELTVENAMVCDVMVDLKEKTSSLMHLAPAAAPVDTADKYVITDEARAAFNAAFATAGPKNGILSGSRSRKVLTQTGLDMDSLGKIWELADMDEDGNLDEAEFAVAMHLIKNSLDGIEPPDTLPDTMLPKQAAAAPPPIVGRKPAAPPPTSTSTSSAASAAEAGSDEWVVTALDKKKFDQFFVTADRDDDGLVSGSDIMKFFLSSRLSKEVLAHVWNLVDIGDTGMINAEQFALAMYFIAQKVTGTEVPDTLLPAHIPPSFRNGGNGGGGGGGDAAVPEPDAAALDDAAEASGDDDDAEIAAMKAENARLAAELEVQRTEITTETKEVVDLSSEIKQLRAEERRMRKEIKEGKERLKVLLSEKRDKKNDKARVMGKISKLGESKRKIDMGIEKAGRDSARSTPSGGGWPADDDGDGDGDGMNLPDGMSAADFFGQ